ncbi:hypothetical protein NDU88_006806 [Pleurodeles waltl]|uniref:Uncharacterized protein n=1 Tax=Pleurodeles waltl TaxID=8319 RepID=A0AAV7N0B0_PLEWA|nr:hypothetical protein NDU88_006806 [Pleurodeles waltl]
MLRGFLRSWRHGQGPMQLLLLLCCTATCLNSCRLWAPGSGSALCRAMLDRALTSTAVRGSAPRQQGPSHVSAHCPSAPGLFSSSGALPVPLAQRGSKQVVASLTSLGKTAAGLSDGEEDQDSHDMIAPRHCWGPVPSEASTVRGGTNATSRALDGSSIAARRAEPGRPFHTAPGGVHSSCPMARDQSPSPWGRPCHTSGHQDLDRLPESKGASLRLQMLCLPGVPPPQPHRGRPDRLPPGPFSGPHPVCSPPLVVGSVSLGDGATMIRGDAAGRSSRPLVWVRSLAGAQTPSHPTQWGRPGPRQPEGPAGMAWG